MTFDFINEEREVSGSPWGIDAPSDLWRYNLHYFDDLNAVDSDARRKWHVEAVWRWMRDNPPGFGDGWAPYPTSLRIVNWIKWLMAGAPREAAILDSLATQVRFLSQRLEYHLLGNHLISNAKALVFAGLFFSGPESGRWLDKGFSILSREIPEQVLRDGGHFERSTMYHALALEDLLDVMNALLAFPSTTNDAWRPFAATISDVARRMLDWLRAMTHPDGEISFFNDAAIGIAPSPAELNLYARNLGIEGYDRRLEPNTFINLKESGYMRATVGDADLIMDVARVGPDYLPGHAHADTLSFELSLFGERVVVNGGTSSYAKGPMRATERSTRAHSTVTVNNTDSSEVWAGFRVARRAAPFDVDVVWQGEQLSASCSHDGYRRLPGKVVHRRTWILEPNQLEVVDVVSGTFDVAIARLHLHPSVSCSLEDEGRCGNLRLENGRQVRWSVTGARAHIEESTYCPEFGQRIATKCLAIPLDNTNTVRCRLTW